MISIENYNENWLQAFETEKKSILAAVDQWIEAIEHVGSTAVPNLPAKPTIDLCIGVSSLEKVNANMITPMEKMGYVYLPELEKEIPERRYLQKLDENGNHLFHIHIVLMNGKLWNEYVKFRDYLIAHPEVAKSYAELKKNLKNQFIQDRKAYTDGKANFIQSILKQLLVK